MEYYITKLFLFSFIVIFLIFCVCNIILKLRNRIILNTESYIIQEREEKKYILKPDSHIEIHKYTMV